MTGLVYLRYEVLRSLRNRRFFVFSLGFPLILFYVIAGPNRRRPTTPAPASRCRSTTWSAWRRSAR